MNTNTARVFPFPKVEEKTHVKADLKNGFAQVSHDLTRAFARRNCSAYQSRVLWVIFEECYSLVKYETKHMGLSLFADRTGLDRRHIKRALLELLEDGVIRKETDGSIGINRNTWEWKEHGRAPRKEKSAPDVPNKEQCALLGTKGVPDEEHPPVPNKAQTGVPNKEQDINNKEESLNNRDSTADSGESATPPDEVEFWEGSLKKPKGKQAYRRRISGKKLEAFKQLWETFDYKHGRAGAIDAFLDIPNMSVALFNRILHAAVREAQRRPDLLANNCTPKWLQGWLTEARYEDEGEPEAFTPEQQQLVDLFNEHVANGTAQRLPPVDEFSVARATLIQAQLLERPDMGWWEEFFQHINDNCINLPPKAIGFDWLMKRDNLIKVVEGNYE